MPSTTKSFLDPKPSILLIVAYMMILPKTNESPKVVGDRSERDKGDMNDMRKDEGRDGRKGVIRTLRRETVATAI